MSGIRQMELQRQTVNNAEDLQFFLRDLKQWEAEIKTKDSELRQQQQQQSNEKSQPPIRGQRNAKRSEKKPLKNKKEKRENNLESGLSNSHKKFDAVLEKAPEDATTEESTGSDDDEDTVILRAKQQAIIEKDKGNAFLKASKLDEAIDCYTVGQQLDSFNPLLPANRALALLKKQQYGAAEADCNLALAIDPNYVKAYQRRAAARVALKKLDLAKEDLLATLRLEPNNREAKAELVKVNRALAESAATAIARPAPDVKEGERNRIDPVEKPENLRSKKPLRRIEITELPADPTRAPDRQPAQVQRSDSSAQSRPTKPEPELPKVPTSSYQFQTDFRRLKVHPEMLYRYVKQIPSRCYSQLFQHNLEPDVLSQMLLIFKDYYMWNGDDLYEPLLNLTQTKRFAALKMFLSDTDKATLREIFNHMDTVHYRPSEELQSLSRAYDL